MASKKFLSVVAASAIAAVVTFTGCGGSSGGSSDTKNVTVSDGYILNATVTMGGVAGVMIAPGVYQFGGGATGAVVSAGGVNDTNGNGVADDGEPLASTMKAPTGYSNVNPFTTILVDGGMTAAELATWAGASAGETFDFDVVAKAKTNVNFARKAAYLAVIDSHIQNGGTGTSSSSSSSSSVSSSSSDGNILPGADGSSSSSSSSVSSSSSSTGSILPGADRSILPGADGSSSSSSVSSSSSSTGNILPGADGSSSSSSSSSVSSSSSSSSSSAGVALTLAEVMDRLAAGENPEDIFPELASVFAAIDAVSDLAIQTNGMAALEAAIKAKLAELNGEHDVPASSSSSSSVSSSSSSSSVSSSSSSSEDDTPPTPGTIPDGSSSSSSSSSVSSSSSSSVSSSSSSSSSSTGSILPGAD